MSPINQELQQRQSIIEARKSFFEQQAAAARLNQQRVSTTARNREALNAGWVSSKLLSSAIDRSHSIKTAATKEGSLLSSLGTRRAGDKESRKTVSIAPVVMINGEESGVVGFNSEASVEGFNAEEESATVLWERTSIENGGGSADHGILIDRRAPLNPFRSKQFRKSRIKVNASKAPDPALKSTKIFGKLIVCIATTALLSWNFLFEHVLSYTTFHGRCVSQVLYPLDTQQKPFIVNTGYGACEYNTGIDSDERCAVGSCTSYDGYSTDKVRNGQLANSDSSWDSFPNPLFAFIGGLDTNLMRNYGEVFRLFWAMYLHAGWLHILLNVSCQIQLFWMLEPDWGPVRVALLFFISGITGNLLSAVCDPCSLTVGSSGAMYGLLGAVIPYSIEYWKTIPRPGCVLGMMIVIILIGILAGFTGITDNYAHMGGCLAGILYGFGTISNVAIFDKCTIGERIALSAPCSWALPESTKQNLQRKAEKRKKGGDEKRLLRLAQRKTISGTSGKLVYFIKNVFDKEGRPKCKVSLREWIVRFTCWACLILIWLLLFLYLLDPSLYKTSPPPGNLKFSGFVPCHCCTVYDSGVTGEDLVGLNIGVGTGRTYGLQGKFWCWSNQKVAEAFCRTTL